MTQDEILRYYRDNGGLRCKGWSIKAIKEEIKSDLGQEQRVFKATCFYLRREAEMYQR